jgi:hypothetical protein
MYALLSRKYGNVHVLVRPRFVRGSNAGIDKAVVPVHEVRDVHRKHLADFVRKDHALDVYIEWLEWVLGHSRERAIEPLLQSLKRPLDLEHGSNTGKEKRINAHRIACRAFGS